jgi:predicted nuclease with TOPRIM domain
VKEYTTLDWLRELLPDAETWQHEIVNNKIERLHAENEALRAKFEAGQADILRLCAENDALNEALRGETK